MKLLMILSDIQGVGSYRMFNPGVYLQKLGHSVTMTIAGTDFAITPGHLCGYDAVVVQRGLNPELADCIDLIPEDQRPALVYEIDDIMWQLGPERESFLWMQQHRQGIKETIRRSDAVIVSTPELEDEVEEVLLKGSGRCPRPSIHILPNAIDFGIRDWRTRHDARCPTHRLVIGWGGSMRPGGDMAVIGGALAKVLKEQPDVCFAIAGAVDQCGEFAEALKVPAAQLYILPAVNFKDYPRLLSAFDVGLAPIADTMFNRCKSELKLLEYGAWGIPYVASNVAPYTRFQRLSGGVGGILASTEKQWYTAITRLVTDCELRGRMGDALRCYVKRDWDLADRALEYEQVLRSVIRRETVTFRETAIR